MKYILSLVIFCWGQKSNLIGSNHLSTPPGTAQVNSSQMGSYSNSLLGVLNILDVYPLALSLNNSGTNQPAFTISSNISWSINSNMSWLTVSRWGGSGDDVITVSATPNPQITARTGSLTISGPLVTPKTVLITQSGVAPFLTVTPADLTTLATQNSTAIFEISSNTSWNVFSNQNWVQTNVQSGSGTASITLTSQKNPTATARKAIITCTASGVPDRTISVTQEAAIPELSVSPKVVSVGALPSSQKMLNVSSNTSWSAISDQSWLKATPAVGIGNGNITLVADQNPAVFQRTAILTLSAPGALNEYVTVVQDAASPYLDVLPADQTIGEQASSNRQILISSNTDWTASPDKSWLEISKQSGSGSGSLILLAQENTTTNTRIALLTFTPIGSPAKTVKVTQLPGKPFLTVSPEDIGIGAGDGSTAVINVSSNSRWEILIDQNWLTASSYNGEGNALILLTALENPAVTTRLANIKVSSMGLPDRLILVTQNAAGVRLSAAPETVSVPSPASTSRYFDVSSNISWSAISNQSWLKLSKNNGNGTERVFLLADENKIAKSRSAQITLSGPGAGTVNISVVQEAAFAALVVEPKKVKLQYTAGDSKKIYIASNSEWIAECPQNWLTISKINGFGSDTLVVTSAENQKINSRITTLTISSKGAVSQQVEVEQEAAPVILRATPQDVLLAASAGSSKSVFIESNTTWALASSEPWLSFDKISGLENDNILFTATANPTNKPRFAQVRLTSTGLADLTIGVTQQEADAYLSVRPDSLLIGAIDQSTQTIDVVSNADWTINSNQNWLNADVVNGSGTRSVVLTAKGNPSPSRRATTLSIKVAGMAQKTVYVTQEAAPVYLSASPQRVFLSAAAGSSDTLQILTNTTWTITADQKWLKANFISGSGNSTLTLVADENTLPVSRTSLVSVQGKGAFPAFVIVEQTSNISATAEGAGAIQLPEIYPNPVVEFLYCHLKNNENIGSLSADLFDIAGNKINSLILSGTTTKINVADLLPGVYLLQVKDSRSRTPHNLRFVKL